MDFSSVLIVSDYDFTLTSNMSGHIPEANIHAIKDFIAKGGLFAVGTGRGIEYASRISGSVPTNAPCIFHNGAVIYDCGSSKIIRMKTFDQHSRGRMRSLMERLNGICSMIIECIDGNFAPAELDYKIEFPLENLRIIPYDDIPDQWLMVVLIGSIENIDRAQKIAEELGLCGVRSLPNMYDLPIDGVNKGSASRELAELCGRNVLVCVGDAPNDIDMLKAADFAFVPESASEAMHSFGFRRAAPCDQGTLSDVIRQLNQIL